VTNRESGTENILPTIMMSAGFSTVPLLTQAMAIVWSGECTTTQKQDSPARRRTTKKEVNREEDENEATKDV
jgi:hypothetical protein